MRKQFKKQDLIFIIILLSIFVCIGIYVLNHDKDFHYKEHVTETIVTIDDKEYPLQKLGFYIIYQETLGDAMAYDYDNEDTSLLWGRRANGTFVSSMARDGAISMLIHDEIFYQLASEQNISLTEEEQYIAEQRLQDYLTAITPSQLEAVNMTEDDLRDAIQHIAIGEKYMLQYAQETGHYYEEYNIDGEAYQELLSQHDVQKNKFLINKLQFGKISIQPTTNEEEATTSSSSAF